MIQTNCKQILKKSQDESQSDKIFVQCANKRLFALAADPGLGLYVFVRAAQGPGIQEPGGPRDAGQRGEVRVAWMRLRGSNL